MARYQTPLLAPDLAYAQWPMPREMSDDQPRAIFQPKRNGSASAFVSEPDFAEISVELSRKDTTRRLR